MDKLCQQQDHVVTVTMFTLDSERWIEIQYFFDDGRSSFGVAFTPVLDPARHRNLIWLPFVMTSPLLGKSSRLTWQRSLITITARHVLPGTSSNINDGTICIVIVDSHIIGEEKKVMSRLIYSESISLVPIQLRQLTFNCC